jgi:integrase
MSLPTSRGMHDCSVGKPLFTLRDTPRRPESIPRYLPAHELQAVVAAISELEDPYQRTALLLVRWSGARRGEIRRLTIDCLDAYSDGPKAAYTGREGPR